MRRQLGEKSGRQVAFGIVCSVFSLASLIGTPCTWAADPAVTKLLGELKSPDEKVRIAAIDALGTLGPDAKEAVPQITAQLTDKSALVRGHAVHTLHLLGKDAVSAAPELAKSLADPDVHVRRLAVKALQHIHPEPKVVVEALGKALADPDPSVRVAALATLTEFSEAAVPVLIKSLENHDTRYWAALALGELGPHAKGAVEALAGALQDEDPVVRHEVLMALARIGPDAVAAVPAMAERLNDKDESVRHAAAFALGHAGECASGACDALRKAEESPDDLQRTVSAWALARIEPKNQQARTHAIQLLTAVLEKKQPNAQIAALRGLVDLHPEPSQLVPALSKLVVHGDEALVHESLGALSTLGDAATPALTAALARPEARGRAAMMLAHLGPKAKAAVAALSEELGDKDPEIRRELLFALASIGPDSAPAVPAIQKALQDQEPRVRATAAYALGRIGPAAKPALPALRGELTSSEPLVRVATAFAVVHVSPGDERLVREALPVLIQGLQSDNVMVRRGSAEAIGQMGKGARGAEGALKAAARDKDEAVRKHALEALEKLGVVLDGTPGIRALKAE